MIEKLDTHSTSNATRLGGTMPQISKGATESHNSCSCTVSRHLWVRNGHEIVVNSTVAGGRHRPEKGKSAGINTAPRGPNNDAARPAKRRNAESDTWLGRLGD